jgi:hypothetical protein
MLAHQMRCALPDLRGGAKPDESLSGVATINFGAVQPVSVSRSTVRYGRHAVREVLRSAKDDLNGFCN